jgi:hypothetical protein
VPIEDFVEEISMPVVYTVTLKWAAVLDRSLEPTKSLLRKSDRFVGTAKLAICLAVT